MNDQDKERLIAACYSRVVREPNEGTITAAIVEHSAACGLVAYVFGVHPDHVAVAVANTHAAGVSAPSKGDVA
jgi:hypothetical protein